MALKLLDWDSEIFGFSMATLNAEKLTSEIMLLIKSQAEKQKICFLQYLCACDNLESIHQAETAGFHFVDIRLTFQKILSASDFVPEEKAEIHFRLATPEHIPTIIQMSTGLYDDFRYCVDKKFPRDKVDAFYHTWLSNAVYGQYDHLCYCLFLDNTPIGYCTIRFTDTHTASLGLFGIAKEHQRQSLGHYLLQLTCADLFKQGYTTINIVTQGKNIRAQRTYQGNGFKTVNVEMWYHQWISIDNGDA